MSNKKLTPRVIINGKEVPLLSKKGTFIVHDTLEEAMDECVKVMGDENTRIRGFTANGEFYDYEKESIIDVYRGGGVFGFVVDKKHIHLWFNKEIVGMERLIAIIAHELGHIQRPYHRRGEFEEKKAEVFSHVALVAYGAAKELLKGVPDGKKGQEGNRTEAKEEEHARQITRSYKKRGRKG